MWHAYREILILNTEKSYFVIADKNFKRKLKKISQKKWIKMQITDATLKDWKQSHLVH